jgi:hypothetical protein
MPFQPINFAAIEPEGNPLMRNFVDILKKGYEAGQLPEQNRQKAESEKLANALKQAQIQDLERKAQDPFGGFDLTGPAKEAVSLDKLRQKYGKDSPVVKQAEQKWDADIERGQFGMAGYKAQKYLQQAVADDNPTLNTPEKVRAAVNTILSKKDTMPDGTKLNITPIIQNAADLALKATTTSSLYSGLVTGAQAGAEMTVAQPYIDTALKYYGGVIGEWSPKLTEDTALAKMGDKEAEERLADWMVGNMLGVEFRQLQERMTTSRVTVAGQRNLLEEATKKAGGNFNTLTAYTQRLALAKFSDAIENMYQARLDQGISLFKAIGAPKKSIDTYEKEFREKYGVKPKKESKATSPPPPFMEKGGSTPMVLDGKVKMVPNDRVEYWRKKGASLQ